MKCLTCGKFSLIHICPICQNKYLQIETNVREIGGIEVISFYKYSEIETLLHTKGSYLGYYILKILAKRSFKEFAKVYKTQEKISIIPIDDRVSVKSWYSHTAILTKELTINKNLKPCYNTLHANSNIKYKGKSLLFRKTNSREFQLKKKCQKSAIVIDDIITTGTTLFEAFKTLIENGIEPKFALTLASVD